MEVYLQPQPDGLPMRESGPWVAEKLDYLGRYIDVFETSMREKPWRSRNYIDLFAGPGKCYVKESGKVYLGSPLLALTTTYPFTHYFFVDSNPQNIQALRERCEASPSYQNIDFLEGDANVVVHEIVARVHAEDHIFMESKWSSLNLAFLDPEGLELSWDTVAALASLNKMDLIIHYSQMGLNRYMGKACEAEEETIIDRFFGGREWRKIYARFRRKEERFLHRALINHYKQKLQALGYSVRLDEETGHEPLIRNAKRRAPLYRLLFASKHPLGSNFWEEVTRRDVYGQGRLPL